MSYKWKPSKAAAREFAEKMSVISDFCRAHYIKKSLSGDSYYFELSGVKYRVSNHTVEASNNAAYNDAGDQVRQLYHPEGEADMICITASKTRIIEIYNDLAAGHKLNRRGYRID